MPQCNILFSHSQKQANPPYIVVIKRKYYKFQKLLKLYFAENIATHNFWAERISVCHIWHGDCDA